jgi:very-short-patch-repair endonuclease
MTTCINGNGKYNFCGKPECNYHTNLSYASYDGIDNGVKKINCWDTAKNKDKTPYHIAKGTNESYWHICPTCNHSFSQIIKCVSKGRWCTYCSNTLLCEDKDCIICEEKSVASDPKASQWSSKNSKTARQTFNGSSNDGIFNCHICGHEFTSIIANVFKKNQWCGFCSNPPKYLCNDLNCEQCKEKSFASHSLASQWSDSNTKTARQTFNHSHDVAKFNCPACKHEFKSIIYDISINDSGCGFCGKKQLCDKDTCQFCYYASFASDPKASQWSSKNTKTARQTFKRSSNSAIFNGDDCDHEFTSIIANIAKGHWCGFCKNKTEKKFYSQIIAHYPELIHQFKPIWCKNPTTGYYMPFDFGIPDLKLIIEVDGMQHYEQVANWTPLEKVKERDSYKEQIAYNNGFHIIRLRQVDIWKDSYNWKTDILQRIEQHKLDSKSMI